MKIQKDWYDQAPLGLGVGCRVSGVGEDTAPTTQGSQAPSFQDDDIGGGSKPTPMLSSLHPTPYPQHPVVDLSSPGGILCFGYQRVLPARIVKIKPTTQIHFPETTTN